MPRVARAAAAVLVVIAGACAPQVNPENEASPVVSVTRRGDMPSGEYTVGVDRQGNDGTVVGRFTAAPQDLWQGLLDAFAARKITPTLIDRPSGRMGDTALVLRGRLDGRPVSTFLQCGSTMTGLRADDERVRAILLAQMTRKGDTTLVGIHLSARSSSVSSGNGNTVSECNSTGRMERELLTALQQIR